LFQVYVQVDARLPGSAGLTARNNSPALHSSVDRRQKLQLAQRAERRFVRDEFDGGPDPCPRQNCSPPLV